MAIYGYYNVGYKNKINDLTKLYNALLYYYSRIIATDSVYGEEYHTA